jgi:hypothetical protein
MQRLRATASLARLVLAWFALTLGVALLSPLAHPAGLSVICGAGGVKYVPQPDGTPTPPTLTLDCALCTPAIVPPPPTVRLAEATPQRHVLPAAPLLPAPALMAQRRPPARGPPGPVRA